MKVAVCLLLFFTTVTLASPGRAESVKFCFETTGDYLDAGYSIWNGQQYITEDNWPSGSYKMVRGADMVIRLGSSTGPILFDGYLGDGLGSGDPGIACSSAITLSDVDVTYWYSATSLGSVQGNTLNVKYYDLGGSHWYSNISGTFTHSGGSGTFTKRFEATTDSHRLVWRAFNSTAYSLYRHAGGLSASNFTVLVNAPGNVYHGNGLIHLTEKGSRRKFVTAHEFGHAVTYLSIGSGKMSGANCGDYLAACPAAETTDPGGHSLGSREYQWCAMKEGLADFYSADIFNDHGQDDCVLRYWKNEQGAGATESTYPRVDCEASAGVDRSANASYPQAFMWANCPPSSAWPTRGTEIDWFRTFWDVHTDGSTPPTFNQIMSWMRDAPTWTDTNVWCRLDGEANDPTHSSVNATWDTADDTNGISTTSSCAP